MVASGVTDDGRTCDRCSEPAVVFRYERLPDGVVAERPAYCARHHPYRIGRALARELIARHAMLD